MMKKSYILHFCNYDAYFAKLCPTGGILGEGVERGQKRMVVKEE